MSWEHPKLFVDHYFRLAPPPSKIWNARTMSCIITIPSDASSSTNKKPPCRCFQYQQEGMKFGMGKIGRTSRASNQGGTIFQDERQIFICWYSLPILLTSIVMEGCLLMAQSLSVELLSFWFQICLFFLVFALLLKQSQSCWFSWSVMEEMKTIENKCKNQQHFVIVKKIYYDHDKFWKNCWNLPAWKLDPPDQICYIKLVQSILSLHYN